MKNYFLLSLLLAAASAYAQTTPVHIHVKKYVGMQKTEFDTTVSVSSDAELIQFLATKDITVSSLQMFEKAMYKQTIVQNNSGEKGDVSVAIQLERKVPGMEEGASGWTEVENTGTAMPAGGKIIGKEESVTVAPDGTVTSTRTRLRDPNSGTKTTTDEGEWVTVNVRTVVTDFEKGDRITFNTLSEEWALLSETQAVSDITFFNEGVNNVYALEFKLPASGNVDIWLLTPNGETLFKETMVSPVHYKKNVPCTMRGTLFLAIKYNGAVGLRRIEIQ